MYKILLIDDDIGILEVVQEILSYEGYLVEPLSACTDILETVLSYKPNLVIMDYFLQGQNGGALCRTLKRTPSTRYVPVLLYSAYPYVKDSIDHFGCDDFIAKPFDLTELIAKVKNLLDLRSQIT